MAIRTVLLSTADTTPHERGNDSLNSLGLESISSYEPSELTPYSYGASSSTTAGSKESTAPYSGTNPHTNRVSLSDRLTPLLISAGLVCGITPLYERKRSDQQTLGFAFSKRGGNDAD